MGVTLEAFDFDASVVDRGDVFEQIPGHDVLICNYLTIRFRINIIFEKIA
jgi:hypothetical protein